MTFYLCQQIKEKSLKIGLHFDVLEHGSLLDAITETSPNSGTPALFDDRIKGKPTYFPRYQ